MESAYDWYTSGPRQRLQPGGKIILVMTRWSNKDLTGKLLQNQGEAKADQWHVVQFPAIMDHGSKDAKPVWPEYWKLDELEKVQATLPTLLNGMRSGCKTRQQKKEQSLNVSGGVSGTKIGYHNYITSYNLMIQLS